MRKAPCWQKAKNPGLLLLHTVFSLPLLLPHLAESAFPLLAAQLTFGDKPSLFATSAKDPRLRHLLPEPFQEFLL